MYWQKRYIKEDKAFVGTSGLETIDLPNKGLLGCIELRVLATTGTTVGEPDVWLYDALEKIELIVNGSQVVKSISGEQLLALMLYQKSYAEGQYRSNHFSAESREYFLLNLGRFYHDLDYMLDLSKVNDPELRLTFDFAKTTTHGWTHGQAYAASPAPSYCCIPHLLRESDIVPRGYIKTHEVYRFTSAGSLKENMVLPRGPLYCNLYLQSWYKAEGLASNLEHLELNINNGEKVPFRVGVRDLGADVCRAFGNFIIEQQIQVTNGQDYPAPIENGQAYESVLDNKDIIGVNTALFANNMDVVGHKISDMTAQAGDFDRWYLFKGWYPFSMCKIPYFDEMDERTWIASAELGDLWLRVEEASGAGTNATIKLLADEVVAQ
jgi:hypothetical protein